MVTCKRKLIFPVFELLNLLNTHYLTLFHILWNIYGKGNGDGIERVPDVGNYK